MTFSKTVKFGAIAAAAFGVAVTTNGCSAVQNAQSALCCPEYAKGDLNAVSAKVDVSIQGQFYTLAQAAGDLAAVAHGAIGDVAVACQNIAVDLGEDPTQFVPVTTAGAPSESVQTANFWCPKAVAKLQGVNMTVVFEPPVCTASVQAEASCQGRCDVSGKCDIKANPPVCTGGTLVVDCKGQCDVTAQEPKIECSGSCSGKCEGTCTAQASVAVDCDGTCEGTCAAGGSTGGTGAQADGSCKGTCNGKCTMRAGASLTCSGSCTGKCDASCKATGGSASVQCSGKCSADYQPLQCKGGTLSGGCQVDASCQANCNASVQARAECKPGSVTVSGNGDAVIATLEKNLPNLILLLKARGAAFADLVGKVVQSAGDISASGKINGEGVACLAAMSGDANLASTEFTASINGATSVLGAVGVK